MSNEIEDLADQLGVDIDESSDNNTELTAVEVDTQQQITASNELIQECKSLYKSARENDLTWRWDLGNKVNDAYENDKKYENSILKRLSEELDISTSDLSRFRKFYKSFDKNMLIERASVGYSWSHFKIVNDLPDGDMKIRMISIIEQEDEAPKTKELQQTINEEKDAQYNSVDDEEGKPGTGPSDESKVKTVSPLRPVNRALKIVDKLGDFLTDIYMQEEAGIEWDTDSKLEKYNIAIDELRSRIDDLMEISNKIWKKDLDDNSESESTT